MDEIMDEHFASSGQFLTGYVSYVTYVNEDGSLGWDFYATEGLDVSSVLGMAGMLRKCVDLMVEAHLRTAYGLSGGGSDE